MSGYPNYPPQPNMDSSYQSPYPPGGFAMPTPGGGGGSGGTGYPYQAQPAENPFSPAAGDGMSRSPYPPSAYPGGTAHHPYPGVPQQHPYPGGAGAASAGEVKLHNPYPPGGGAPPNPYYGGMPQNPYPGGPGMATAQSNPFDGASRGTANSPYPSVGPQSQQSSAYPQQSMQKNATYQLSVSCRKLVDRDVFSKSDPVCVLSQRFGASTHWQEVGRTECIKNNLDPSWHTKFKVQERQDLWLRFQVFDWDDNSNKLRNHDFLASHECPLAHVLSSPGQRLVTVMKSGPSRGGQLIVEAEKASTDTSVVKIGLVGRNLDKKDSFGKSDPFFVISKMTAGGGLTPVHKSEVINNNLNPKWQPFSISVGKLCNGDYNCTLKFDVYDYDGSGKSDLIGSFSTNLAHLSSAMAMGTVFNLVNPKKTAKRGYRNSGEVVVAAFTMWQAPNFRDA